MLAGILVDQPDERVDDPPSDREIRSPTTGPEGRWLRLAGFG
jgi:hypothetical protein